MPVGRNQDYITAGDAWGEKPRLHYSWRCLEGLYENYIIVGDAWGEKPNLHCSWRCLGRETQTTSRLEMPDGETKTTLQPGDACYNTWGEKSKVYHTWWWLDDKRKLHYRWRCLGGGRENKTTLQLEMPAIIHEVKNQKFITRGDGWMTNGNYITDGGAWEEKSKIKPH